MSVNSGHLRVRILLTGYKVHRAIRYVLLNARKHARRPARKLRIDSASSGRWFDFWCEAGVAGDRVGGWREVVLARGWLLMAGWRRYGRIGLMEVPGPPA